MGWTGYKTKSEALENAVPPDTYEAKVVAREVVERPAVALDGEVHVWSVSEHADGTRCAFVALVRAERGWWMVKLMSEEVGPFVYDVPADLRAMLCARPMAHPCEYATRWRKQAGCLPVVESCAVEVERDGDEAVLRFV